MSADFGSWIGKSVTREDVVTQRLMDEHRATLAPHLFKPHSDKECPPGLHWCLGLPAHETKNLGPDGAEAKGMFLPPAPLPRRRWAGGRVETFRALRCNDKIKRISTISDVKMREGKAGDLCFVSVTHDITANDELAIRERHDILFREAGKHATVPKASPEPPVGELEWIVEATPLLLFRFSAVTSNGHRIHYDLPYAKEVEDYGGLLVHGPLQAAFALNQLSVLQRTVPKTFDYRCVAPLVSGQAFRVVSKRGADGDTSAVIIDSAGVLTIEAEGRE